MKVLELCLSSGLGGLELYFIDATLYLIKKGHQCIPVVNSGSLIEVRLKNQSADLVSIKRTSRYLPILNALRLARLVDSMDIDVVHMHWAKDLALAVLIKTFSRLKPRLVYTRHMEIYGNKKDWYHRFVYRHVDLMLTVTDRMAGQARTSLPLPQERIQTLHLGIPEYVGRREDDSAEVRGKYGIPPDAFLIGMAGRIEPGKRQHVLIEACESLAAKCPDMYCMIIGGVFDPEYANKIKLSVNQGPLRHRVIFTGFFDNPKQAMAAFNVAVLATYCETFGLVLVEAMSTGTAVIGTRAGGVPEIIEDGVTGLMFEPDNSAELAEKILSLYTNKDLRSKLANAGRQSVKERFDEKMHWRSLVAYLKG